MRRNSASASLAVVADRSSKLSVDKGAPVSVFAVHLCSSSFVLNICEHRLGHPQNSREFRCSDGRELRDVRQFNSRDSRLLRCSDRDACGGRLSIFSGASQWNIAFGGTSQGGSRFCHHNERAGNDGPGSDGGSHHFEVNRAAVATEEASRVLPPCLSPPPILWATSEVARRLCSVIGYHFRRTFTGFVN